MEKENYVKEIKCNPSAICKDEDKSITIENKSTDGVIVGFTYE